MSRRVRPRVALLGLFVPLVLAAVPALTAANTVPSTRAVHDVRAIALDDLKPGDCGSINVTSLVTGSGVFSGTAGNDLILGGSGGDTISAGGGNDCVLGGGGNDTIDGGLLGQDVCVGGPGTDVFVNCETQVQ
jgi:hypothetical protein